MTLPAPFPAARYRLECRVETDIRLPEYAGSALRGAFGQALRRCACVTRQKECKPCPLYRTCPYPAIFSPPPPERHSLQKFSDIPAPFIIEPPAWGERHYREGDTLVFHLVLIGKALAQLPLIIFAWQKALARGIGRGDGQASLSRLVLENPAGEQIVYTADAGQLAPHPAGLPPAPEADGSVSILQISTPLRLQDNGRPLGSGQLTARHLLVNLLRRVSLVSEFHLGHRVALDYHGLAETAAGIQSDTRLVWRDWTRYSSRQKQEMTLGGVTGQWTLKGNLAPFAELLHLGQWLHVGKNASFGLGRYELQHPV